MNCCGIFHTVCRTVCCVCPDGILDPCGQGGLALGEELGVPLHTAAAAMQIFHAGKTKYPDGDNWVCTRVIEEIIGAELHREGAK